MADELGYGQPMGGIAQTAFVVEDLRSAIDHWTTNTGAGPFFVLPHFLVPGQTYRGEESKADITIGMGFAGHMLIELIQPLDDHPSVYKETIAHRGHGFHHFGLACADVDAASEDYQQRGYVEAFRAAVPTGGEVVYLDDGNAPQWGFLELLPVTPGMDETFTRFWKASQGWDGSDPVRPFL
ncbi:VOC family protein [Croceibacterium aestuarii]|uniref:VOC family protein n=1 Tax=Croceibacterium aestuarii TaxID=3064139 RepID=UPI00272EE4D6|nr:VOC family protein [Croceibacterium sp. D39]